MVIVHGSKESARSHTGLALALADAFTVYLPDRRGRGMSGPFRPGYGIRTEVEDLEAVLAESGAADGLRGQRRRPGRPGGGTYPARHPQGRPLRARAC